jgi:phosphoglucomutase
MGALLMDYILLSRTELGKMPAKPAVIRSIVTSPFSDAVCKKYGVKMLECLTGFKWIAAVEARFEAAGTNDYVFGLEESYGYKVEKEVMDKDGISAAALCSEMTLYWRAQGKSILEHLDDMYRELGYFEDVSISKYFPGATGIGVMNGIMAKLRSEGLKTLGGKKVVKIRDIQESVEYDPENVSEKTKIDFPRSNVIQFFLAGGTIVSARPSGTEPKIKFYINSTMPVEGADEAGLAEARTSAHELCSLIKREITELLDAAD